MPGFEEIQNGVIKNSDNEVDWEASVKRMAEYDYCVLVGILFNYIVQIDAKVFENHAPVHL